MKYVYLIQLSHQFVCQIMAILLHYAYMSTFCWMLIEALHLYRLIVVVYGGERNLTWLYYAIGWGEKMGHGRAGITIKVYLTRFKAIV